jgi:hypothetical protein
MKQSPDTVLYGPEAPSLGGNPAMFEQSGGKRRRRTGRKIKNYRKTFKKMAKTSKKSCKKWWNFF